MRPPGLAVSMLYRIARIPVLFGIAQIAWSVPAAAAPETALSSRSPIGMPRGLSIEWDAPAACPTESAVRAALHRWLELTPEGIEGAAVEAHAHVRPSPDGWQLELTLVSPGGRQEETLVAARCETIVELVALKVALAVNPTGLVQGLEETSADATSQARGLVFGARGVFGVGAGVLPGTSVGVAAVGSLESRSWRLELGAQFWFPRPSVYPQLPSVGADVELVAGEARGCALPAIGGVVLPICAGFELGVMRAVGFGTAQTRASDQLWAAVVIGPALRWHLVGPMSLWLEGEALLALNRPEFHFRNLPLLYKPEPAAAQGWAGLEVRFD